MSLSVFLYTIYTYRYSVIIVIYFIRLCRSLLYLALHSKEPIRSQNQSVILYPIYLFDVIQTGTDFNPKYIKNLISS